VDLRSRVRWLKAGVWLAALIPAGRFVQRWFFGDGFGVNPIEELLLWSGLSALVLLFASLAVTPLRRLTGWNELQKVRRLVGLWAFAYAGVHVGIYLWLDQFFAWGFIWEDVTERPFIIAGTVAFLFLLPLALTSTRGWIRRLGRRWVQLHWLVYPAAGSALLHYVWKQKADFRGPIIAGVVLALLLGLRVWWRGRDKAARAAREETRSPTPEPQGQPG
jgi:sulfoxide reductase heme-binding subunit YedZ